MNKDFPRILCLLRKENDMTQAQLADKLDVSQTMLSHYENVTRDCSVAFLEKAAEYFDVSTDYLLGRSVIRPLKTPEKPVGRKGSEDTMIHFNRKLVRNSVDLLFSLISECEKEPLVKEASGYLMLSVYKMFRKLYASNPKNDMNFFRIESDVSQSLASSAMSSCEAKVNAMIRNKNCGIAINTTKLIGMQHNNYVSMMQLIQSSEAKMEIINSAEK